MYPRPYRLFESDRIPKEINEVSRYNAELVKASVGDLSIDIGETIQSYSDLTRGIPRLIES